MRKQIAAANWKMNTTLDQATNLLEELREELPFLKKNQQVILAIPFPYLALAKTYTQSLPNIYIAAQNCHHKAAGAYTGEVSVEMLQSLGIEYVIIGHSERRAYFNESNALIAEKINMALQYNIQPIFCCGEPLDIRKAGIQNDFITQQLQESLQHLTADKLSNIIIAYEPIWAIGTGETATATQAEDMHTHIRSWISTNFGTSISATLSILYGGSVNAGNAKEIFNEPNVDGGLVGGASLKGVEFVRIVEALK